MRAGVLAAAMAIFGAGASAAGAFVPAGVVPDVPTGTPGPHISRGAGGANLDFQGGPVMHTNRTYVIYWKPSNCTFNAAPCAYDAGYQSIVNGFLANVAADSHKASNVYGLTGQYGDATGRAFYQSTFVGTVQDSDPVLSNGCTLPPPPPTSTGPGWTMCVSNSQLRAEVNHVIAVDHLPTGIGNLYFVVMPNGFGSCFLAGPNDCSVSGGGTIGFPVTGSFCGYHTATGTVGNPTLYSDMPYNAVTGHCRSSNPRPNGSTADPEVSTLSHEHIETITDPLPVAGHYGWIDTGAGGQEIGDLCAASFGTSFGSTAFGAFNETIGSGHYLLQGEWSNEDSGGSCQQRDETDSVNFSVSGSRFVASASDPDGSISAYAWNFGDGSPAAFGANVSHAFSHTGTFTVTLTIQDISGQRASVSRAIHVTGATITKIRTSSTGKFKARLSVSVSGPGTVRVGGAHVSLSHAGTARFSITIGSKGHKKLARRGVQTVTIKIKVKFTPAGGATQTRTIKITFSG